MELLPESFGERGDFQQGFLWFDTPAQPQAVAAGGGSGGATSGLFFSPPGYSQLQNPFREVPPLSMPLAQPLVQIPGPLQPPPPLPGATPSALPPLPLPQSLPLQPSALPQAAPLQPSALPQTAPLQPHAASQPMQLVPINSLHSGAMPQPAAGQLAQQEIVVEQIAGQAVGQVQQPIKTEYEVEMGDAGDAGDAGGAGRGGVRGRGRGRGRGRVSEEERKARNRATQARFRERQKVKNEQLLAEHAATEAALERTLQEREGLQAEHAVLQKLLVVRDEVLLRLSRAGGADSSGASSREGPPRLEAGSEGAPPGAAQAPQLRELQPGESGGSASGSRGSGTGEAGATTSSAHGGTPSVGPSSSASAGAAPGAASPRALQRRTSSSGSGGGMSRLVARQMEMLSHDITAHMAQLELPVNTHPDETMRISLSLMQELPSQRLPAPQQHADQPQQPQQPAGAPAAEQQQEGAGSLALVRQAAGGGAEADGALQDGSRAGPHGLADLIRERPELVEKVLAMSAEQLVAEWQQLASNFREVLAAHEQRQSEEGLERILDLFREWGGTMTLTLHFRPENAEALFSTAGDAPPGMWETACAQLEPTEAQRHMLAQLWQGYAAQAQAIRGERAAAVRAVQDAAQHAASVTPATLPASTLGGLMSQYLDMFNAAGRLSTLRDAEFVAMLQLLGRTGAVFSPVQKARLAAAAYPYFPDVVQIVRILASRSSD
ncbi:hypothetical protein ABPG77_009874 [Micractinium sp. CCAP 211/92]